MDTIGLRFDWTRVGSRALPRRFLRPAFVFEFPSLEPAVRAAALRNWEQRCRSEYMGVLAMSRVHGLAVALNAPLDWQELFLRIMLHEQEHARMCAEVLRGLGGEPVVGFRTDELEIPVLADSPVSELLLYLCRAFLGTEAVAYKLLRHTVRTLPPSPCREVMRLILADEVLHGNIGFLMLESLRPGSRDAWLEYPGDAWVAARMSEYLEGMLGRDLVDPEEVDLFRDPKSAAGLLELGIPEPQAFKRVYSEALTHGVPARLRALGVPVRDLSRTKEEPYPYRVAARSDRMS